LSGFVQMIRAVESEDWNAAAGEMMDSTWARQVGLRARELSHQMRTGEP